MCLIDRVAWWGISLLQVQQVVAGVAGCCGHSEWVSTALSGGDDAAGEAAIAQVDERGVCFFCYKMVCSLDCLLL